MPAAHFTCPRCAHLLRSDQPIAPGKHLRCPHCRTSFRAGLANETGTIVRPGRGILLAWLVFGGAVLLMGGGIGLAMRFHNKPKRPPSVDLVSKDDDSFADRRTLEAAPPPPPAPVSTAPQPVRRPAPPIDPLVDPPNSASPPPLPAPPSPPRRADNSATPKSTPPPQRPESVRSEEPQVHWLPAPEQFKVDKAIDRGVEFLRRQQHFDGTWGNQGASARYTPGITALSALTLLECGVAGKDSQVQLTAHYLRERMPAITATYSIATTILFLDRLGEQQDVPRLRTLALRLIAGQKPSGGWDYFCPTLGGDEELGLLALLYKDRPTTSRDLFLSEANKRPPLDLTSTRKDSKSDLELYRPKPSPIPPLELFIAVGPVPSGKLGDKAPAPKPPPQPVAGPAEKASPGTRPTDKQLSPPDGRKLDGKAPPTEPTSTVPDDPRLLSEKALAAAAKLSPQLRQTPALNSSLLLGDSMDDLHPRTDNSNTQFAVLGLLAAEKYDVPMERVMALIDWRFRKLATDQGGWDYQTRAHTKETMTCAGLLGLALKHGLLLPNAENRGRHVSIRDPFIGRALFLLNRLLDPYFLGFFERRTKLESLDLYCMWSVERVAVLYNLRKIGDLAWYPVGVRLLLPLQQEDGSWSPTGTTALSEPVVSTSFALLFFKRSNLSPELTRRLNDPAEPPR